MSTATKLAALAVLAPSAFASAAAITPGNVVVYRVGDGSGTLGNASTAVFLDEYSTTGALVQSFPLPSGGPGALTASGSASSEGLLTVSPDGKYVALTGYNIAAGTGNASLPAAQRGAQVTASDLTPELLAAGERRAEAAGLQLAWREADAEHLPFDEASFDVVMSAIGVMFAPHHQEAADDWSGCGSQRYHGCESAERSTAPLHWKRDAQECERCRHGESAPRGHQDPGAGEHRQARGEEAEDRAGANDGLPEAEHPPVSAPIAELAAGTLQRDRSDQPPVPVEHVRRPGDARIR